MPSESTLLQVLPAIAGDFNNDGVVDAADDEMWRKNDGSRDSNNAWRDNFGNTLGGSGTGVDSNDGLAANTSISALFIGRKAYKPQQIGVVSFVFPNQGGKCFMKTFYGVGVAALVTSMFVIRQEAAAQNLQVGQAQQSNAQSQPANKPLPGITAEQAAEIKANLATLGPEDRELAEAQGFCPIMLKNRLGVMGPPIKVMVKDQPVFVCCKGCMRKAQSNPDRTLQIVSQLKIREALSKLSPKDRQLAVAQGYCPVMRDNPLGVMGTPVKVMVGNEPVFLCCAGCKVRALANPDQTLAIVAELKAKVATEAARQAKIESERTTQ